MVRLGAQRFFMGRRASAPSLPYDARVLYVETDGVGSYLDTGIIPVLVGDSESKVHVEFSLPRDPPATLTVMFGARYGTANYIASAFCCTATINPSSNRIQFLRPTLTSSSPLTPVDHDTHSVDLDRTSVVIDGIRYDPAGTVGANMNPIASFCLGASVIPSDTSASSSYCAARFYGCRIITGGNTVFDGIPVRKNGQGYIYDRVSGRLCGNAGAAGTSVTYGADVPFDEYVEYLESTGTQWIDTGVIVNDNNFVLTINMCSTTAGQSVAWSTYFGSYSGELYMSTRLINNGKNANSLYCGYRRQSNGQNFVTGNFFVATNRVQYIVEYMKLTVVRSGFDDWVIALNQPEGSDDTSTVKLFGANMRCWAFDITHDGEPIISFTPVRFTNEQNQSEGAMYDRVSGQLFRNAGTGAFPFGSDK